MRRVLQLLRNYCSAFLGLGPARHRRGRFKDGRFGSFMAQNNRPRNTDRHDAMLRGRKVVKSLLKLAVLGGGAWIVLESAKALSVF